MCGDGHVVLADDLVLHPALPVLLQAREVERPGAAVDIAVQLRGRINYLENLTPILMNHLMIFVVHNFSLDGLYILLLSFS